VTCHSQPLTKEALYNSSRTTPHASNCAASRDAKASKNLWTCLHSPDRQEPCLPELDPASLTIFASLKSSSSPAASWLSCRETLVRALGSCWRFRDRLEDDTRFVPRSSRPLLGCAVVCGCGHWSGGCRRQTSRRLDTNAQVQRWKERALFAQFLNARSSCAWWSVFVLAFRKAGGVLRASRHLRRGVLPCRQHLRESCGCMRDFSAVLLLLIDSAVRCDVRLLRGRHGMRIRTERLLPAGRADLRRLGLC
jgi:hypothetical protein